MDFSKIELIGFKSFADRQEIKFDNGVTCIVGPNGCGKSNVADAIRWVLGEQSAKTLRGSSMQDVIFNGTQSRKSLSYCEVSLFFDNSNKIFKDIDYSEVQLTRKLFRSGESEYYINKKQARLRDIVDLLHECGVSKEGYTIIGQGKVSEILSSKPEDRRTIFEEAVGISKTKAKRLESMRKLERTRDSLIRLADIMSEQERQLEPLARQAEKAREFRQLSEELKYHEVNSYLYKYNNAASEKAEINTRIQGISEEIVERNNDLDKAIKEYNAHQRQIAGADEEIKKITDEIIDKTQEFEAKSGDRKVFQEKISFFRTEIERLQNEINAAISGGEENSAEIKAAREKIAADEAETERLNSLLSENDATLYKLLAEIDEGERRVSDMREALIRSTEDLADRNLSKGSLTSSKDALTERIAEVNAKIEDLKQKLNKVKTDADMHRSTLASFEKFIKNYVDEIKDKEADIASINAAISEVDGKIYKLNTDISTLEANRKFYANIKDSYDGFQFSVKKIMQAASADREISSKVKGIVANIVKTDAKYDVAIETCLGGFIQNIVVDTPEDAQYLINYLKRVEGGRATFLPVTAVKPRYEMPDTKRALHERGALGLANELVSYDKYFDGVVRFILGNTLIVDNIDNAVLIAKKYRFAFKIVTLDGDVLSSNGSMTGGSRKQNSSHLLAMDRKTDDIDAQLKVKNDEIARQRSKREMFVSQVEEGKKELTELSDKLQSTRQEASAIKEKIAACEIQINDFENEISENKSAIDVYEVRLVSIENRMKDADADSDKIEEDKKIASSEVDQSQAELDKLKKQKDELTEKVAEARNRVTELNASKRALTEEITRLEGENEKFRETIEGNRKTISSNNELINKLVEEIEKVSLTDSEREYLAILKEKRTKLEDDKLVLAEKVKQDELNREMAQSAISKLTDRKHREEVALTKVDSDLEYMQQRVWEEYSITYESALPLIDENYDTSVSAVEIARLRKRISGLGSINPEAIEQFTDLNERYQEYVVQRDDLLKAEADLNTEVKQLTEKMSVAFADGFAKIRQNFTRIFKELFGGGTADLVLEPLMDGQDPLEQGVEIVAEPPGKKLQKISLLSGGEMSLTAIAILFAILRLRPMPFVVLDEIEAALDDANVERFARYLKQFSKETQFIVITHKKVTMELGDALYGVTMPEKGVSKIVSVKLADVVDTLGA